MDSNEIRLAQQLQTAKAALLIANNTIKELLVSLQAHNINPGLRASIRTQMVEEAMMELEINE